MNCKYSCDWLFVPFKNVDRVPESFIQGKTKSTLLYQLVVANATIPFTIIFTELYLIGTLLDKADFRQGYISDQCQAHTVSVDGWLYIWTCYYMRVMKIVQYNVKATYCLRNKRFHKNKSSTGIPYCTVFADMFHSLLSEVLVSLFVFYP